MRTISQSLLVAALLGGLAAPLAAGGRTRGLRGVTAGQGEGLAAGQSAEFTFTLDRVNGPIDLSTVGVGIKADDGPNGCRTRLSVYGGVANTPNTPARCVVITPPPPPPTVTPEPISMTLMATGLAGVGAAHRRRRKQQQDA